VYKLSESKNDRKQFADEYDEHSENTSLPNADSKNLESPQNVLVTWLPSTMRTLFVNVNHVPVNACTANRTNWMYHDEWSRQLLSTPLLAPKHKPVLSSSRRWPYPFVTGDLFRMVAAWIFDETGHAHVFR
jgi:hypothetical protein